MLFQLQMLNVSWNFEALVQTFMALSACVIWIWSHLRCEQTQHAACWQCADVLTVSVMQRFSSCKLLLLSLISKRSRCSNRVMVSISFSQRVIKTAIKNSIKGKVNKGDSTSCAWRPNGPLCLCYQITGQYTHFRLYKGNRAHGHVIAVYWLL